MSKPLPTPVFDRRTGGLIQEFMDDSPATYESRPHRPFMQWKGLRRPGTGWSRPIKTPLSAHPRSSPFVRKHGVDMSEFEPGPTKPDILLRNPRQRTAARDGAVRPACHGRSRGPLRRARRSGSRPEKAVQAGAREVHVQVRRLGRRPVGEPGEMAPRRRYSEANSERP